MKGLCNLGQTCFFNAAAQCLVYSPNMANYFLSVGQAERDLCTKRKGAFAVAEAFIAFTREYWTKEPVEGGADVSQVYAAFVKACRGFGKHQQHDAHEAIVCLLDKLHEGLCRMKPGQLAVCNRAGVERAAWLEALKGSCSVVSEVFRGQIEATVQAQGYTGVTHDHFTCLSLAVNECSSLTQCFQRHMGSEVLADFKVDGKPREATITKRFTHLPRILVVHFKRFDALEKIDRYIEYTSELDLSQYAAPGSSQHYQLFAVCLHRGTTQDGHYTACCEVKGRWYVMDDESVTRLTNINNIIQRDAYVLFYKRL